MRKGGYYTIEATFIMAICIGVIVSMCYVGLYVHDRIILSSDGNEGVAQWISQQDSFSSSQWEREMKKKLGESLFLLRVSSVKVKNRMGTRKVTVTCDVSFSFLLLKKLFANPRGQVEQEINREVVVPAQYKWDMEKVTS